MVTALIACNTFLQTIVDNENRSGLMALYVAAMTGIAPIGSILVGWMGEIVGTSAALSTSGVICALSAGCFAWRLQKYRHMTHRAFIKHGFHLKAGRKWEWM